MVSGILSMSWSDVNWNRELPPEAGFTSAASNTSELTDGLERPQGGGGRTRRLHGPFPDGKPPVVVYFCSNLWSSRGFIFNICPQVLFYNKWQKK